MQSELHTYGRLHTRVADLEMDLRRQNMLWYMAVFGLAVGAAMFAAASLPKKSFFG